MLILINMIFISNFGPYIQLTNMLTLINMIFTSNSVDYKNDGV